MESNHRPQGYEPCELPLLYPAERPARIELASSATRRNDGHSEVGSEGFEPPFSGLKVRCVAVDTTTLCVGRVYAFQTDSRQHCVAPCSFSGRLEDRTQRGSVISRTWATSPRRPFLLSRAPRGRTENLLVPNQACSQLHLCPILSCCLSQNGRI